MGRPPKRAMVSKKVTYGWGTPVIRLGEAKPPKKRIRNRRNRTSGKRGGLTPAAAGGSEIVSNRGASSQEVEVGAADTTSPEKTPSEGNRVKHRPESLDNAPLIRDDRPCVEGGEGMIPDGLEEPEE